MQNFIEKYNKLIIFVGFFLGSFLLVSTFIKLREYKFVGSGINPTNTISVSGTGKIERAPDTAKISFSIKNENKDMATAQSNVSQKIDSIKKELINSGIEEKYIKTDSYNSHPQYDYVQNICMNGYCQPNTPKLRGYEVSHMLTVSIKDLSKIENILEILGRVGVTDMNGPSFGFEDDKAIFREARDLAIADAKIEAEKLSKSLDVNLIRIVSFSENTGGYPTPMYTNMMKTEDSGSQVSLPIGDQNIKASVTLVYEIR